MHAILPSIHSRAPRGRDAAQHGSYGTDYRNTGTSSFLEHYTQRLSAVNVMHGAAERLKAISSHIFHLPGKKSVNHKRPLLSL